MRHRVVRTLFTREVRSALRERSVVVNGILLPVLLYPALLWVQASALVFVSGLSERSVVQVAVHDPPAAHPDILARLAGRDVTIRTAASPAVALGWLAGGEVDAVAEFRPPGAEGAALGDNFRLRLHYDGALDRSRAARERVEEVLDGYRDDWILREGAARGVAPEALVPFEVRRSNVSSREDLATELLSLTIPLFLVVAVALACLVPAVDTTAGERERGTWDTLLSAGSSREEVVVAKYLHVASFGAAAGILNATVMTLVVGPVLGSLGLVGTEAAAGAFSLSGGTWGAMAAGAVLLGLFFAAAMMLLAGFAKTFKDGQAMVTPVFYLALLPLVLGQSSERTLTPTLALLPVANVAMMIRDAIRGIFLWPLMTLTLLVSAGLVLLCLHAAAALLSTEDFILGVQEGGPLAYFRRWRASRGARV